MERLTVRLTCLVACLLLVAACGPTATVITTPPPGIAGPPLPSGGLVTLPPPPTVSVPPNSRWQLLSGFPAHDAYELVSLVTTPDGFVAAGAAPVPGEGYYGRSQGLVWTSADGQTWQVSADPALLYTEPLKLVALGSNQYVVGDYEPCSSSDQTCADANKAGYAVFQSSSGSGWTMLPENSDMRQGTVDGMIAGHDQLLVYGGGSDADVTTTLWRSSNGTDWTASTMTDLQQITAMAATATGFVMFALTFNGSSGVQGLVARSSTDGSNFSPLTLPDLSNMPYPEIDGVTTNGSSVVGVGFTEDDQGNDTGLALFSPDGTSWSVGHDVDGSFANSDLVDAVAIDRGYLAFGYSYTTADAQNLTARAWFSADGQSWRALADLPGAFTDIDAWGASSRAAIYFTDISNDTSGQDVSTAIFPWYGQLDNLLAF